MQPSKPVSPPPAPPTTPTRHEPPTVEEQPDEDLPGEQPRSRSNEGDPLNAPN